MYIPYDTQSESSLKGKYLMPWVIMGDNLLIGPSYSRWNYDIITIFVYQKEERVDLLDVKKHDFQEHLFLLCRKKSKFCNL